MRTWIIGAAALLAAAAAPGVASAASGYVGLNYSNTDVNHGGSNNTWGADGSVVFSGSSQISFELDGAISDGDHTDTADQRRRSRIHAQRQLPLRRLRRRLAREFQHHLVGGP